MMKAAVVVVWFNPDKIEGSDTAVENILSYSKFFGKVYVVDNSSYDNSELAEKLKSCVYISNKNANGIAGALNKGCAMALKDGFDWVITMDQDSSFNEDVIVQFLEECEKIHKENELCVSFGPNIKNGSKSIPISKLIRFKILSPIKRAILRQSDLPAAGSEFYETERLIEDVVMDLITSGNIVNLEAWNKIGGYDEQLFIDFVDFDFTYRLHNAGYKICRLKWLYINHALGEKKRHLFERNTPFESDFRLHYIFRNLLVMMKRYPEIEAFKTLFNNFYKDYCVFNIHFKKYRKILKSAKEEYAKIFCQ